MVSVFSKWKSFRSSFLYIQWELTLYEWCSNQSQHAVKTMKTSRTRVKACRPTEHLCAVWGAEDSWGGLFPVRERSLSGVMARHCTCPHSHPGRGWIPLVDPSDGTPLCFRRGGESGALGCRNAGCWLMPHSTTALPGINCDSIGKTIKCG